MANCNLLAVCAFLCIALLLEIVRGQPISPEDVVSLLPETPKTTNETVAAIVQDAVVQDAVQSVVGDGTLSGLVVKKNTVILPASQPDVVLTQNEQILTAPLSNLEDIRKNITETAAMISEQENSEVTGVEEIALADVIPLSDKIITDTQPLVSEVLIQEQVSAHPLETLIAQDLVLDKEGSSISTPGEEISGDKSHQVSPIAFGERLIISGIAPSDIKLPEGISPNNISLPEVIDDKISKPIVAVLQPENIADLKKSVIAFLPASPESSSRTTNSEGNLNKKAVNNEYGEKIPVAVITSKELDQPAVQIETKNVLERKMDKRVAAVFAVPEYENFYFQSDENDMVAAEDIIFRPLFRYRQQQNERRRILEDRSYQQAGYNRYRPYSSIEDYDSPGRNTYRKRHRTRYYNDYS